jgi:AcrR family transcriptional regulator
MKRSDPAKARPYHHGNLRETLIEIGLQLAREGGPEAVSIRDAARRAGVSANAAYRHFKDLSDLLSEVAVSARGQLAASMQAELTRMPKRRTEAARAREQLSAVGRGYIRFALTSPQLFRCAWAECSKPEQELSSWRMLEDALQACARAGLFPANQVEAMGAAAWSLVHGFSELALRGLLGTTDERALTALGDRVVELFQHEWEKQAE